MSICDSLKEKNGTHWGMRVDWRVDGEGEIGGRGLRSLLHRSEEKQHL